MISILTWFKFFGVELKQNPLIAFILVLMGLNTVQYYNYETIRNENKVLVEQRIQEQKDLQATTDKQYKERLSESADAFASRYKMEELTREIQILKNELRKKKR